MKTIIDTDALLGLFNPQDAHHTRATALSRQLIEKRIDTAILTTTLSEFALLASSRIGVKQTKEIVKKLVETLEVINTTEAITQEAVALYEKQTSKEESLFDCYIMIAAKQYAIESVFSFDRGYVKNGFMRVSDLLKNK